MKQKKLWKKCILIFTILTLVTGATLSYFMGDSRDKKFNPSKWEAYSPSDQRFDIQFPSDPKESSQEMNIANKKIEYRELSTEDKESLYAVSYIDFPGHWKWLGTKKLLTKSFEMYVENEKDVEAVKQEMTTHQGNPSLDYQLKQAGKEIKGKFVIVGNTLYRMTVTYPIAAAEKIKPEAFFDSFQVKA